MGFSLFFKNRVEVEGRKEESLTKISRKVKLLKAILLHMLIFQ